MNDIPVWAEEVNEELVNREKRVTAVAVVSMSAIDIHETRNLDILEGGKQRSFASWVRVVAYLKRFWKNLVAKKSGTERTIGPLTFWETSAAEITLIKAIQHDAFGQKDKKDLNGLEVFVDRNGAMCVKSRVIYREDLVVSTTPYLLPGNHPLVQQLIMDMHVGYMHAGVGFLLTKLRKKYYLLKERKSVRAVVTRC